MRRQHLPCRAAALLAAGALYLALAAARAGAAPEAAHPLLRSEQPAGVAGTPPVVLAATVSLQAVDRNAWEDQLLRLSCGGFNAVYAAVPWNVGTKGSLTADDLGAFLEQAAKAGLKAIVGPRLDGSAGDCAWWLSAVQPALKKQAATVLWVQAGPDAGKMKDAARTAQCAVPVAEGTVTSVVSGPDPLRPYREPSVGIALREALGEGASALVWGDPFAGVAPPLPAGDEAAPVLLGSQRGMLPLGYYEAHLFGQVLGCLGDAVRRAQPAEGASADAAGVAVRQRNAGSQGYLFVRVPQEEIRAFHLAFTDPATGEKLVVPRTPGLALRSFGAGARILPLNLPVPGATIRYCTSEVYGVYPVGKRTAILVTDDDGAPNEIALKLEGAEKPAVGNTPVEPIWDAASRTLTVGYVATFGEMCTLIGDNLMLVVVPTERAQRTWTIPLGETPAPAITSAYLVGRGGTADGKVVVPVLMQQGKSAVTMLLDRQPRYIAANGMGAKMAYDARTSALNFTLEAPPLAGTNLKPPILQVITEARFGKELAATAEANAQPGLDDSSWPEVRLGKAKGAGLYRVRFRLPAPTGWILPWKATLQISGKATVYLNGKPVGSVESADPKGGFVDLDLPDALVRSGDAENVLALAVEDAAAVRKIGIAPYMEHVVQRQPLVFFP